MYLWAWKEFRGVDGIYLRSVHLKLKVRRGAREEIGEIEGKWVLGIDGDSVEYVTKLGCRYNNECSIADYVDILYLTIC